jgi:hypothetical protein
VKWIRVSIIVCSKTLVCEKEEEEEEKKEKDNVCLFVCSAR